jgi:hypothetical protein
VKEFGSFADVFECLMDPSTHLIVNFVNGVLPSADRIAKFDIMCVALTAPREYYDIGHLKDVVYN